MPTKTVPAGHAKLALTAGVVQPGDADRVSLLQPVDVRAHGGNNTDPLMTGNEGERRLGRPIAVGSMEVGMADPGGDHLDQDLAPLRRGNRNLLDGQRLAERPTTAAFIIIAIVVISIHASCAKAHKHADTETDQ